MFKIPRTRLLVSTRDHWDTSWSETFRELELAQEAQSAWSFINHLKHFTFFTSPEDKNFLHHPHWLGREIQGQLKTFKTQSHQWFVSDEEANEGIRFEKKEPLAGLNSQDVFSWVLEMKKEAKILVKNREILDKWRLSLLDTQKILCDFYLE